MFCRKQQERRLSLGMNSAHCKEWLTEKVLPNIEDKTVIVTDNAPCHSKQTEESKKPNASQKKKKMQD